MISTLKKKLNKKGFTLAELLIVVAIIGVLVAIAIPVLNNQLASARVATDKANLRAAYSEAVLDYLEDGDIDKSTITYGTNFAASVTESSGTITVKATTQSAKTTDAGYVNTYSNGTFSTT